MSTHDSAHPGAPTGGVDLAALHRATRPRVLLAAAASVLVAGAATLALTTGGVEGSEAPPIGRDDTTAPSAPAGHPSETGPLPDLLPATEGEVEVGFVGEGVTAPYDDGSTGRVEDEVLTIRREDGTELAVDLPAGPSAAGLFPRALDLEGTRAYLVQSSDGEHAAYDVVLDRGDRLVVAEHREVPLGRGSTASDEAYYSFVNADGALFTDLRGAPGTDRSRYVSWYVPHGTDVVAPRTVGEVCADLGGTPVTFRRC